MTEMERILKESLLALEGELAAKLHRQETWLSGQQTRMEDQGRQIQALRREVLQLREGQQTLMRALAALERRTRELVACADALEQRFGQQIGVPRRLHMRR